MSAEYTQYAINLVLSAMAPETIVAAVAQNTRLNTNELASPFSFVTKAFQLVRMSRLGTPQKPAALSMPTKSPNPRKINTTVPMQKSIRFFIMMFPALLALVKPVSTIAKPACMKKTNAAPMRNQIVKLIISLQY